MTEAENKAEEIDVLKNALKVLRSYFGEDYVTEAVNDLIKELEG